MKRLALVVLAACGTKPAPVAKPTDPTPIARPSCAATMTTYGVVPFKDKTGKNVDVTGMDELLAVELTKDPCITVVERARLQPIIDEIAHCDPDNPDRAQFDCDTFAPSGKILGIQYMVFADLVMYEPSIAGGQLAGRTTDRSLDAAASYGAIGLAVRTVSVETGKVAGGETIDEIIPAGEAKLDAHSVQTSSRAGSPAVTSLMAKVSVRVHAWH